VEASEREEERIEIGLSIKREEFFLGVPVQNKNEEDSRKWEKVERAIGEYGRY